MPISKGPGAPKWPYPFLPVLPKESSHVKGTASYKNEKWKCFFVSTLSASSWYPSPVAFHQGGAGRQRQVVLGLQEHRNLCGITKIHLSLGLNPPPSNSSIMEGGWWILGDLVTISATQNFKLPRPTETEIGMASKYSGSHGLVLFLLLLLIPILLIQITRHQLLRRLLCSLSDSLPHLSCSKDQVRNFISW